MGLPVGPHQTGPVHGEDHMDAAQGHVVDQHIVGPLEEAGIDGKDGAHPLLGQARRHGRSVALGDAHVEKALREAPGEVVQARAVGHGGGDRRDAPVVLGQLNERRAEDGGEVLLLPGVHPPGGVEGADAVIAGGVFLRRGVALALFRADVEQHRPADAPGVVNDPLQGLYVMAVHRAKVIKTHILEHIVRQSQVLHPLFDPVEHSIQNPIPPHRAPIKALEAEIAGADAHLRQKQAHAAHVFADAHGVVVQEDQDVLAAAAAVGQTLIGHAACEGPVADDGHHAVVLPQQGPGPGHAQGHGDAGGGVAADGRVVRALIGPGEARQPAQLPQGVKAVPPPGEQFMGIALVPHVEHQAICRAVIDPVQRHGQLHRPQGRGQVAPVARDGLQHLLPQLLAELRQHIRRQRLYIRRRIDSVQSLQYSILFLIYLSVSCKAYPAIFVL